MTNTNSTTLSNVSPLAAAPAAPTSAAEVGAILAAGGPTIGAICFWTLGAVHIRRDVVRAKMAELGLLSAVPRDPSASALLTKACDDVKRGRRDVVFDRVSTNATETVMALSERAVDPATEVASYRHVTRVRVSHADGGLTFEDPTNAVMAELAARYADLSSHMTTAEFGGMMGLAFQGRTHELLLGGVNLRGRTGGVYFVPEATADRAAEFADFVNATGCCSMTVWPIATGDRAIAQATAAARSDIQVKIREMLSDIGTFAGKLDAESLAEIGMDSRGVRIRMDRFEQLTAKAEMYSAVLGSAKAEIEAEIERARLSLQTAVLGRDFSAFEGFETPSEDASGNSDEVDAPAAAVSLESAAAAFRATESFDAVPAWG